MKEKENFCVDINAKAKKINTVQIILSAIGFVLLLSGVALFLYTNAAIFFNTTAMCIICAITLAVGALSFIFAKGKKANTTIKIIGIVLVVSVFAVLILIAVFGLIIDFFQPLALSVLNIVFLFAGAVVLLSTALISLICKGNYLRSLISISTVAILFFTGVLWATLQGYGQFTNITSSTLIFESGDAGYKSFRIPSLVLLNKDVVNEKLNTEYESDLLLALAEARKDSSKDIGEVDLVYRMSIDGGKNWTAIKVLRSVEGEKGKVGNPTAVYTSDGAFILLYLEGKAANGYSYLTYSVEGQLTKDLEIVFGEPTLLNTENNDSSSLGLDGVNEYTLMVGPGKAIELNSSEYVRRIVAPCSNRGFSYAIYSDDGGKSWTRGQNACEGNECEITELSDGTLMMVSRDNTNSTLPHFNQHLRFRYSTDGGESWVERKSETNLRTPICMTSIATLANGNVVVTYPDCYATRADLSIAISENDGRTFTVKKLYDGPSGYSCVVQDGAGKICLLAEIGKVNYSEAIAFLVFNND